MKILNIIAILGLTTLPIVGCSKKENKTILSNKNEAYELNLKKGFVYLLNYTCKCK